MSPTKLAWLRHCKEVRLCADLPHLAKLQLRESKMEAVNTMALPTFSSNGGQDGRKAISSEEVSGDASLNYGAGQVVGLLSIQVKANLATGTTKTLQNSGWSVTVVKPALGRDNSGKAAPTGEWDKAERKAAPKSSAGSSRLMRISLLQISLL